MKVRYAGLEVNDFLNGEGVSVSFWTQGCPHKCTGCHNPETHDFNGGIEIEYETLLEKVLNSISNNGIIRNFSILGGEPLCPQNIELVTKLIQDIKNQYPNILIYCWTGYTFAELLLMPKVKKMLKYINVLIDGRFVLDNRDVTLKLRGSTNQRVIDVQKTLEAKEIILIEDK